MNKNIKKLAMEADFMLCEDGNFYSPTDSQYTPSECYLINTEISKFAELIIEQCAELVDNAWDPTGEQLKRHFGMAPPMGYNEEELDRDSPYNQWMNHAQ